jgi:hypothetical protein
MWLLVIQNPGPVRSLRALQVDYAVAGRRLRAESTNPKPSATPPRLSPERLPLPIACRVFPRAGGTRQERQTLGTALYRWSQRALRGGTLEYVDNLALLGLLGGESPEPLFYSLLGVSAPSTARQGEPEARPAAEDVEAEDGEIFFTARGGKAYSRQRLIDSLRQDIPENLVEDVLIDGRSWKDLA